MNKAFKLKTTEDFNNVEVFDTITLTYDDRYRRRILMKSDHGLEFLLDLAKTTELRSGNFIELEDGRLIEIIAASEKLMKASSDDQLLIMKGAWHIGNRHLSCEIDIGSLTLRFDHNSSKLFRILQRAPTIMSCSEERDRARLVHF